MSNTKLLASGASHDQVGRTVDVPPGVTNRSNTNLKLVAQVGAVVLIIDQITKIWAASALEDRDIDLFWTLRLHLIENFGSAFGLGSGLGRWLGLLIIGVIVAVILYARTIDDRRMLFLFGLITGGAIGNIIDRVARAEDGFLSGGVIDFIDLQWWPVFNVADMAVVCGAVGLMVMSLLEPDAAAPNGESQAAQNESVNSDSNASDAAEGDAADSDSNASDAAEGDAADRDAAEGDAADRDAADSDAADRDAADRDAADRDAADSDAADRDAADSDAADSDAGESDSEDDEDRAEA